jgi:hypothetical protein
MVDHPANGPAVIVLPVWFRICRLRRFVEEARTSGLVMQAAERAGLKGAVNEQ